MRPSEAQDRPFLTGVGIYGRHTVFADADHTVPYSDPAVSLVPHPLSPNWVGQEIDRPGFGFHDACWTLLLGRVKPTVQGQEPVSDDTAAVAARLYDVLCCLVGDRHRILSPAQDYGGAWRIYSQGTAGIPHDGAVTDAKWEILPADPRQTSVGDAPLPTQPTQQAIIQLGDSSSDIFARIPGELVVAVINELPSADLCSLRLASRAVASLSSPASLPNSFWYSRFGPGFEMGFYAAGRLPGLATRDWYTLYRQLQYCLARPSDYPGLCNRHRMWHVLGDLSATLQALLEGSPLEQTSDGNTSRLALNSGMVARVPREPSQVRPYPRARVQLVWDAETQLSPASTGNSSPIKISASFIRFDGRFFLCGMRATTSTPDVTLSRAGLIRPSTEQHFILQSGQEITKVRVICSGAGVVGAEFFIQMAESENVGSGVWHPIGVTKMPQAGLGVAELKSRGKILGLALEFDASPLSHFTHTIPSRCSPD